MGENMEFEIGDFVEIKNSLDNYKVIAKFAYLGEYYAVVEDLEMPPVSSVNITCVWSKKLNYAAD